jgi:multiple sugar transport system permease protein
VNNTKFLGIKRDTFLLYALVIPSVLIVLAVTIYPLICTFVYSFENFKLTDAQNKSFAGLDNYIKIFSEGGSVRSMLTTLTFTFFGVLASLIFGLCIALLVNSLKRSRPIFRVVFSMPMLLSSVVVGVMWKFLLNNELGIINFFTSSLGMGKPGWLDTGAFAVFTVILVDVWQWTPYVFILTLAGLESLPLEPVESARIDGANAFQIFRYLTLPGVMPVLKVAAMFRIIWTFRSFDLIFSLTKGGPGRATETMALSIWRTAFEKYQIGEASAQSVLMFLVLMLISIFLIRSMNRKTSDI